MCRGFSDVYGSWKIIWMSRRSGLSCARRQLARCRLPSKLIAPPVGLVEPGDQPAGRRLAAAGLADQAQRAAGRAPGRRRRRRPARGRRCGGSGPRTSPGSTSAGSRPRGSRSASSACVAASWSTAMSRRRPRRGAARRRGVLGHQFSSPRRRRPGRCPSASASDSADLLDQVGRDLGQDLASRRSARGSPGGSAWCAPDRGCPATSSGISVRHRSPGTLSRCVHRGWNAQPDGGLSRLGGLPGIGISRRVGVARRRPGRWRAGPTCRASPGASGSPCTGRTRPRGRRTSPARRRPSRRPRRGRG